MSSQNPDLSPAVLKALELIDAGQSVQAEEMLIQSAQLAEKQFGPESPQAASAYNELGLVLTSLENHAGSVHAYRRACVGSLLKEKQTIRDQLTYLMNLGTALLYTGQLEEAEAVLRLGLEGRKDYYGVEHAGYAFGLEPLATVLMHQGKIDEALQAFNQVVDNFWRNSHPHIAGSLALRAEAFKIANQPQFPFTGIEGLPDDIIQDIVFHVIRRVQQAHPAILSKILQDLLPTLRTRFGQDHALVIDALTHIVNFESMCGKQGNYSVRVQAARDVLAICERQGQSREALQAMQGLAFALSDMGRSDDAIAIYQDAALRAQQIGDPVIQSQIRRNLGLLFSELKRDQEAEAELRNAVQDAQRASDSEMLSRGQIALGIFYQHRHRFDEAKPLLVSALQNITPAHSDAVIARSHLQALEAGQECNCANSGEALAAAFREFVIQQLPPDVQDLLEQFEARLVDQDFQIEVHLNREPTQEEVEHLNRVVSHALAEFRRKLREIN